MSKFITLRKATRGWRGGVGVGGYIMVKEIDATLEPSLELEGTLTTALELSGELTVIKQLEGEWEDG